MNDLEKADNFLPRVDDGTGASEGVNRHVVSLTAPASRAAEQYRTLYYRLERMRQLRPMKMVAFTSAMPGEGKTVTVVNLALVSARANPERRILLVDADLRRSQVAAYLGIKAHPGLAELIAEECEVKDTLRRFRSTRLAVVPAGATPEEPTQLLASARMRQFLEVMRQRFDEVYLDLPPTLPFADANILGSQADGVVLVVRANVTPHRCISQAIDQLHGSPLVGCVLNGTEPSAIPYLRSYSR
ncbi:MAG: CpsD/CapB family tyrosine-protein kinase [Myxococcota bacterium]